MKLQTRLSLMMVVLISITSGAIGYFSVTNNYQSQVRNLDKSVSKIIQELKKSKDDPLFLSTYLAEISNVNIGIDYVTSELDLIPLNDSQIELNNSVNTDLINKSVETPIDVGSLRLRAYMLNDNEYLLLYYSLVDINESRDDFVRLLLIFTFALVAIASLISMAIFRKDNQLNNLVNSLQRNQDHMQEFIGDASHELKTPLTIIKGYFELIDHEKSMPEKITSYKSRINSEIQRMQDIINDLLFITELDELGTPNTQNLNISKVLSEYIFDLKNLNPKRVITTQIEHNVSVKISQTHVAQILSNIFSNIKRHTPSDSEIEIILKSDKRYALLTVEDSGAGLPKEFYANGIQAFRRYDKSRSRDSGGSGLGMTILEKTTKINGGKVLLSPSKFGGLKIQIYIPLA